MLKENTFRLKLFSAYVKLILIYPEREIPIAAKGKYFSDEITFTLRQTYLILRETELLIVVKGNYFSIKTSFSLRETYFQFA